MTTYDVYTAVAMQPEIKAVEKREDIRRNLKRCLELIDAAPQIQPTAKEHYEGNWAPIKLISFPEFFITGREGHWPFDHYVNEVLIEIPGEETRLLAEKAREYGVYIAGCALEGSRMDRRRFLRTNLPAILRTSGTRSPFEARAEYHYHLGMTLIASGQKAKGKEELDAALHLKQDSASEQQVRQALAQLN
jgi:hypothetical protein